MRSRVRAALLLALVGAAGADTLVVSGRIDTPRLPETSGLAVSQRDAAVLWAVNDSGNPPLLVALAADGAELGSVRVKGAVNADWEDLASFTLDAVPYLLIADTGDNRARRRMSRLYVVPEPHPDGQGRYGGSVQPAWQISFRFAGGPRDCEAVAVDPDTDSVLLVSKRDVPARLYRLPLRAGDDGAQSEAELVAELALLPRATPRDLIEDPVFGAWRHQPTALDIGVGTAALLTYQHLYLYRRKPGESWAQSLLREPDRRVATRLRQNEAVAVGVDAVHVTSEGAAAPLLSYPWAARGETAAAPPSRKPAQRHFDRPCCPALIVTPGL